MRSGLGFVNGRSRFDLVKDGIAIGVLFGIAIAIQAAASSYCRVINSLALR